MNDPYIYVDLETTGLNVISDRICQIGAVLPDGQEMNYLINPGIPIAASATEIHGITNEMLVSAPKFEDIAAELITALENSKIFVAYNFVFDFQVLQSELLRTVKYELKEEKFCFIDPYKIFRKMFPHNLSNAYLFYTGHEMTNAHNAIDDIRATKEILDKQKEMYPELFSQGLNEVQKQTVGDPIIFGKWFEAKDDKVFFRQGKFKGEEVDKVHKTYLDWIMGLDDTTNSERRFIIKIREK